MKMGLNIRREVVFLGVLVALGGRFILHFILYRFPLHSLGVGSLVDRNSAVIAFLTPV